LTLSLPNELMSTSTREHATQGGRHQQNARPDSTRTGGRLRRNTQGELVSSIRLHVAHRKWNALPALDVFSDLLSPEIAAGRTIVDPTRFVIDRSASRRYPELCYVTTRLAVLAAEYFSTDLLLATVRAEHQAFYRRVFGHRLACEPRHYPLLSKPICLMALDYPLACERLLQRQPFFRSTGLERRTLFARAQAAVPRSAA